MSNRQNISRAWEMAKHLPELKLWDYLDNLIPDVPLTPELKLCSAIFGERKGYLKSRLIEAYLAIHLPRGNWKNYKKNCIKWVTALLQESISRETDLIKEPVQEILTTLIPREIGVLQLRFGFDGKSQTLREIGEKLSLTHERIRQIEADALRKLRYPSRSRLLRNRREWLRARVFLECEREHNWPALFPFWIVDREEVEWIKKEMSDIANDLRDVEGAEGLGIRRAIALLKRQNVMMKDQLNQLFPRIKALHSAYKRTRVGTKDSQHFSKVLQEIPSSDAG